MTCLQLSQIAKALSSAGDECVLATLVNVSGSSFRRPGARMLIHRDRAIAGGISAGCLEEDIRQSAFDWTRTSPCLKEFRIGTPEDDLLGWGSGCKGTLQVLLQRIAPEDSLIAFAMRALESRQACLSATLFDADPGLNLKFGARFLFADDTLHSDNETAWLQKTLAADAPQFGKVYASRTVHYTAPCGRFSVLWENVKPPIQLCVFGSGDAVGALLNAARNLGWKTLLCNKRTELYNRQCGLIADQYLETFGADLPGALSGDDRTAAVVMTHHFADDLAIVESLLQSAIPYVGVLGGRTRNQRLRDGLAVLVPPELLAKLVAPIGLDVGAEEPVEIALSITSEVLAFMNGRSAGPLLARNESVHAPLVQESRVIRPAATRELAECREF